MGLFGKSNARKAQEKAQEKKREEAEKKDLNELIDSLFDKLSVYRIVMENTADENTLRLDQEYLKENFSNDSIEQMRESVKRRQAKREITEKELIELLAELNTKKSKLELLEGEEKARGEYILKTVSEILPQSGGARKPKRKLTAYNRHVKAYFKKHPKGTLKAAAAAWRKRK